MTLVEDAGIGWKILDNTVIDYKNCGFSLPTVFTFKKKTDGYIIQHTRVKVCGAVKHEFWEAFQVSTTVIKPIVDYFNHPPDNDMKDDGVVTVIGEYAFYVGELPADFSNNADNPSGATKSTKQKPAFFAEVGKLTQRAIRAKKLQNGGSQIQVYSGTIELKDFKTVVAEFTG